MKVLLFFLFSIPIFSQVGIGTTQPMATLDINGDLMIRKITEELDIKIAEDSILVISKSGAVKRINAKHIISAGLKSVVKGGFSSTSDPVLLLSSDVAKIPFDEEEFDLNDEYDVENHFFIAKNDGIYDVYSQVKTNGVLSANSNFGVSIFKNNKEICKDVYDNIKVLGISVSSPIRRTKALVKLNSGDTLTFKVESNLLNISLLNSYAESYFVINQIR